MFLTAMKRKQLLASGLFDNISVGFNWWDVVLKISVATVFTRCMKSFNLLDKTIVIGSLRITLLLNSIQECQAKYVEKSMNLTLVKN